MTAIYLMEGGKDNFRLKHVAIAERALGHELPDGAEVHHVDGRKKNNANQNLVICPSRAYHMLLHARTRALDACGNANWVKCVRCGGYGDPASMRLHQVAKNGKSSSFAHPPCGTAYERTRDRDWTRGDNYGKRRV